MITIKLVIMAICGGLNVWGGYSWHNARRFIMPLVISLTVSLATHTWWVGLPCLLAIAPLCTGYGEKSFFWKYFNDAWGRFLWASIVSLSFCLGLIVTNHLALYIALIYIIGNGILQMTLRKYNQLLTDALFGVSFCSFILFLR